MRTKTVNLLFILIISACGKSSDSGNEIQEATANTSLIYDFELSSREQQEVERSVDYMQSIALDGNQIRYFTAIFGGATSANVLNYFYERINYVLSGSTEIDSRVLINGQETEPPTPTTNATTLAINWSMPLWTLSKASMPDTVEIKINEQNLPIPSSRIGVMQISLAYTALSPVLQVTTLVHEGRHSDCTGGLSSTDLERFKQGQLPLDPSCGHSHALCPPGHEFEGEYACDTHPWGAYAIGAVYSGAIVESCNTCTTTEAVTAEIISLDSFSRLLINVESLLNGDFGPPDMSSSDQVR